ncbi:hypothetical protein JF535_15355 [Microbulbifer salipaludis]|uniref:PhoD-like phosphatase metallophosphatase domain-containing protein n=1 Tax=Microbulbifer salipaludis TaxID=187980 RepID=A0ABS3EA98_9GAMM|nr:hypothetical protein [Microbulbifer salipaludis]MBN8432225.1 hypothetical protein [Microbulbifer salipaludis]
MDAVQIAEPVTESLRRPGGTEEEGRFLLVPHGYAGEGRTRVWVGDIGGAQPVATAERLWLRCEPVASEGAAVPLFESRCRDIPMHLDRKAEGLRYTLLSVPTAAGCSYRLSLWQFCDTGAPVLLARGRCEGQPASLTQRFNLWFGTCFYRHTDHGALAEAFTGLPEAYRPNVSVLGGDQVYLDTAYANRGWVLTPGFGSANFSPLALRSETNIRRKLRRIFSREYRKTWRGGLRQLLSAGQHYFLAGDHEFWNDYPNPPGFLPTLWSAKVRHIWRDCARQLFDAYQLPDIQTCSRFDIGDDLSFFVLDTRLQRGRGRDGQFTDAATLERLQQWLTGLRCPGVLVLPAPVLTRWQSSGKRSLMVKLGLGDHTLADTGQYETLVRALNACPQDVLIVAGDVHFSRLARFELNGKKVLEVVSSPLSCLPSAPAAANQHPDVFPDRPIEGIRAEVEYLKAGTTRPHKRSVISNNNFVTLSFTRACAGVSVDVVCWNVNARNGQGEPAIDWECREILLRTHKNEQAL